MTAEILPRPTAGDLYRAGLLASALGYLGIVMLVAISWMFDTSDPGAAVAMFFFGGFMMLIPAVGIAFLVTAPLGCVIGIGLREWLPPNAWHGAINGIATMAVSLALMVVAIGGEFREVPDAGTIVFVMGLMAIGAGAGWFVQHRYLGWPPEIGPDEIDAFE